MAVAPRAQSGDLRAPIWLAHHHTWQLDRCICVGHVAVCRRCAVLYPSVALWWVLWMWIAPSTAFLVALGWALPLPMVIDWVLEHLRRPHPAPARLMAVTLLASPGFAAMLTLHTRELMDPRSLLPAVVYGGTALATAWCGARRSADEDWRQHHAAEEARRARRLRSLLDLEGHDKGSGLEGAATTRNATERTQSSG